MSDSQISNEVIQALRERIERETPWLQVINLAHGYVEVKDTHHSNIHVGFRRECDWQDYLRVIGPQVDRPHARGQVVAHQQVEQDERLVPLSKEDRSRGR
jgi:hypothetical protein